MLTIYSRNIFGIPFKKLGRRFKGISQQIAQTDPDVVLLQEFVSGLFLKYFRHHLENYNFFYLKHGLFTYGGLLTMVKKTIKTSRYRFTQFKDLGPKYNLHLIDNLTTRGFQSIYLPKYDLCLINTHILSKYLSRKSFVPVQLKQIGQIRRFFKRQTAACFLTGDFNFHPDCQPYQLLLNNSSLIDASHNLGHSVNFTKKRAQKLDYVFVDPTRLKVKSIAYLDDPKFLSDHRAIITKINPTVSPTSTHPRR
jgi:endonuclease/exonuclease/phosphatase family metal-dependent hydrolase